MYAVNNVWLCRYLSERPDEKRFLKVGAGSSNSKQSNKLPQRQQRQEEVVAVVVVEEEEEEGEGKTIGPFL